MAVRKRRSRDIYQEVTDRIVQLLSVGTVPWRNPIRGAGSGWPKNLQSGSSYRGINVFLLAVRAMECGFSSDYWLTFRQAQSRGGSVRKGEQSSLVIFWKQIEKRDEVTGESAKLPVLRHYRVFNAEQCEGIILPDAAARDTDQTEFDPLPAAERIVAGYRDPPEITKGGSRAFYRPATDHVTVPDPDQFDACESYYLTLFHELAHSTGHRRRLDRGLDTRIAPFGSPDYSREELVAEMSAAFLAAAAGISEPTIEASASYLDNWTRQLKGDKRLVVNAAGAAQRSADWILGTTFNESATPDGLRESESTIMPEPSDIQLNLF